MASARVVIKLVKRILRFSHSEAVMVASGVDPPLLTAFALGRFRCWGLEYGSRVWNMGASPELEGVGVGALEGFPEAREEAGQGGSGA